MITVTSKRKVLSIEGKEKRKVTFWEFGLINFIIQMIWKSRTKITGVFEQEEYSDFESLKEVMLMRCCVSGSSNRELVLFS
jgi:hypothetical protein